MEEDGLEIPSIDPDIQPPGELSGDDRRFYSVGGLHLTLAQAEVAANIYSNQCENEMK